MFRCLATFLMLCLIPVSAQAGDRTSSRYDPLVQVHTNQVVVQDTAVLDSARQREIPVRIYRVQGVPTAPVIPFRGLPGLAGAIVGGRVSMGQSCVIDRYE